MAIGRWLLPPFLNFHLLAGIGFSFFVLLLASNIPSKSQFLEFPKFGIVKSVLFALVRSISFMAMVTSLFVALPYLLVSILVVKKVWPTAESQHAKF